MSRSTFQKLSANPFAGWDVPALLDQQAKLRADHVFLVWEPFETERLTWTYASFAEDTRQIAAGMARRGIGKGDFEIGRAHV